jgi:hypothetical protein
VPRKFFEDEDGILFMLLFKLWNHPKELENRNLEISSGFERIRKLENH